MQNRNFLMLALLVVFGSFLVAFSNAKPESKAVYEYVTVVYNNNGTLIIFEQGKERIQEAVKNEKSTLNAAYSAINKFEAQGYELFSNESIIGNSLAHSYLLRRKKQ
ncbi:hypothetical protein [Adhaeribacter soli]|uniref:Uncharacterized protein n=1 Tax=Adhaeribacter soli TaxID=2607655 RepID=A0A5N1ISD1_9BACT|nr:hypothetical protein [Adhaeribacter soli]KAA9327419.1 hypothetical protein F0P94_16015 [Adhaeribacter soli]